MRPVKNAVKTLLALTMILPCLVLAEDAMQAQAPIDVPEAASANPVQIAAPTVLGAAMDSGKLDQYRGGSDVVINDMKVNGSVKDNIAANVITGTNSITDGSFSNASGIPVVIQNTGANVLIQNATIVNVRFK